MQHIVNVAFDFDDKKIVDSQKFLKRIKILLLMALLNYLLRSYPERNR